MKKRFTMLAILVAGFCSTPSWAVWVYSFSVHMDASYEYCYYYQADPRAKYAGYSGLKINWPINTCPATIKGSQNLACIPGFCNL